MDNTPGKSSVLIKGDTVTLWSAITNEDKLSQWYVPGSHWKIPYLKEGEQINFTLMPNAHNNLTEEYPMSITIDKIIPYKEFSIYIDDQQMSLTFILDEAESDIKVTIYSEGFHQSSANLKALAKGNEIPFV